MRRRGGKARRQGDEVTRRRGDETRRRDGETTTATGRSDSNNAGMTLTAMASKITAEWMSIQAADFAQPYKIRPGLGHNGWHYI